MPLSNGLRFRRRRPLSARSVSARRLGVSGLAQLLPKTVILPIILFAGITAATVGYWTYDIHVDQTYADIDEGEMTGTVDSAN